jgi:serine/threonine kinase 32
MAFSYRLLTTSYRIQSKKANFDASHELEELLLEDNPLKAKARKQNRDINSLSAEMRQMEEQCVEPIEIASWNCTHRVQYRFTIYDFRAMRRRSYYPHNQQIVTTVTATSSSGMVASRPVTPGDMINGRSDDIVLDSQFIPGVRDELEGHSSESHHHPPVHIGEKGKENV